MKLQFTIYDLRGCERGFGKVPRETALRRWYEMRDAPANSIRS